MFRSSLLFSRLVPIVVLFQFVCFRGVLRSVGVFHLYVMFQSDVHESSNDILGMGWGVLLFSLSY